MPPAVEASSPNHWTSSEVPRVTLEAFTVSQGRLCCVTLGKLQNLSEPQILHGGHDSCYLLRVLQGKAQIN